MRVHPGARRDEEVKRENADSLRSSEEAKR